MLKRGISPGAARLSSRLRHVVTGAAASALAIVGLVAFATPAFAHDNLISANASCASPLGSGYTIAWTIQNDFNEPETGSVTSVTGGLSSLSSTSFSVAASPGQPYSSTTLTQTLPATASGPITLEISSRWADGFSTTDATSYNLSQLNCGSPKQTIAGHIYLCNNSAPTTTEQSGGTLAASGPTTLSAAPNPLAPTQVDAGGYTMTATPPSGYTLVACTGSSTPNSSGSTATESVTVPSGGAGVGIFYVVPVSQTIAGHIYLCNNSAPTTTEQSGGTLAASGPTTLSAAPNPLAPTQVDAGGYTMTATPPSGYTLVACTGSSTPNSSGSTATESVTVPSGGAGVGIFYVVPVSQTIAGHIYLCNNSAPTTTEQSGGTLAASGPTTLSAAPNPLAPTQVDAGGYTMTATPPSGYTLVACTGSSTPNSSGSTATESVTVPSGGAGVGIFYVVPRSHEPHDGDDTDQHGRFWQSHTEHPEPGALVCTGPGGPTRLHWSAPHMGVADRSGHAAVWVSARASRSWATWPRGEARVAIARPPGSTLRLARLLSSLTSEPQTQSLAQQVVGPSIVPIAGRGASGGSGGPTPRGSRPMRCLCSWHCLRTQGQARPRPRFTSGQPDSEGLVQRGRWIDGDESRTRHGHERVAEGQVALAAHRRADQGTR